LPGVSFISFRCCRDISPPLCEKNVHVTLYQEQNK
jgi:hypothetical protein